MTNEKIERIEIKAKEWFDKANGNSYFSARIYINDKEAAILPFQYGYGDHYIDMANQWLSKNNYINTARHENGMWEPLWRYCDENNIHLSTFKQDRCLKRELDK